MDFQMQQNLDSDFLFFRRINALLLFDSDFCLKIQLVEINQTHFNLAIEVI